MRNKTKSVFFVSPNKILTKVDINSQQSTSQQVNQYWLIHISTVDCWLLMSTLVNLPSFLAFPFSHWLRLISHWSQMSILSFAHVSLAFLSGNMTPPHAWLAYCLTPHLCHFSDLWPLCPMPCFCCCMSLTAALPLFSVRQALSQLFSCSIFHFTVDHLSCPYPQYHIVPSTDIWDSPSHTSCYGLG
jgi:hypothetical protein